MANQQTLLVPYCRSFLITMSNSKKNSQKLAKIGIVISLVALIVGIVGITFGFYALKQNEIISERQTSLILTVFRASVDIENGGSAQPIQLDNSMFAVGFQRNSLQDSTTLYDHIDVKIVRADGTIEYSSSD